MRLACTMTEGRGELDPLLHAVARAAMADGLRLAGIVQINSERPGDTRCDMDALVLPDGPVIRISQSLGPGARGCQLDAAGLETAVAAAETALAGGADLLIVNKFGKQEAAGRGFRNVIARALELDADVLVGVNRTNLPALEAYAGTDVTRLPPAVAPLLAWVRERP
ncbi:ABC-type molybdate transport system, ATPase component [Jannaschia seosinensis]|uniref:ABC-type molybdate transport system, ATPase component n=2 Tax=Jannaschia seosinensis TaxID=313367 RepID=A0A0M7BAA0_9RHOB|nr:ABC-type molybdate transport system, ATPase component [Jannaschia seosinensis]